MIVIIMIHDFRVLKVINEELIDLSFIMTDMELSFCNVKQKN